MTDTFLYKHRRIVFIASFVLALIIFGLFLNVLYKSKKVVPPPAPPIPTPITTPPTQVYELQKTVVGKTTEKEIEENPTIKKGILKKEVLSDGQVKYSLKSALITRPNEIITQNRVSVFERIVTPDVKNYARASEYTRKYGRPDQTVTGSHFYFYFMKTYIYSRLGFALIVNPNTDEIFEFQAFKPTSVENYTQQYGEDLNPGAKPPEEEPGLTEQGIHEIIINGLKEKLPYYGENFTILYDKSTDKTKVFIYRNVSEGEKEFDEFLKQNGVENRSWITNLSIEYP